MRGVRDVETKEVPKAWNWLSLFNVAHVRISFDTSRE